MAEAAQYRPGVQTVCFKKVVPGRLSLGSKKESWDPRQLWVTAWRPRLGCWPYRGRQVRIGPVCVSENVIKASLQALVDSMEHAFLRHW